MEVNTDKIKRELERREWRPSFLAAKVGITKQGILNILKTKKTKFDTLEKIASVLDFDAKDLIV